MPCEVGAVQSSGFLGGAMSKNQTMSQGARSAENVCLAGSVQGAQTLGEFDSASVDAPDDSTVSTALHPLRLLGMGLFCGMAVLRSHSVYFLR